MSYVVGSGGRGVAGALLLSSIASVLSPTC